MRASGAGREARAQLSHRLRTQARACAELGSPLYSDLLERAARDVEAGGIVWRLLTGHEGDPGPSAIALRLMGAVHRLVLTGRAPGLAAHYPSAGGAGADPAAVWDVFRSTIEEQLEVLRPELDRPVQTNEVARCAALLIGFMAASRRSGLPLRLLEVGSSAGLNLRWDRYRYGAGAQSWGPSDSPVDLGDPYEGGEKGPFAAFDHSLRVTERAGCDPAPVDPSREEGRITLESYVWADMEERRSRLLGAIRVALGVPAPVQAESARTWVPRVLARRTPGRATVIFHSVVMQYLTGQEREAMAAAIASAGEAATPEAPLGWLRMEPARRLMEIRLQWWPGGGDVHLADAGAHGRPVRLLGPA